jgi:hypothetical protein
MARSGTNSAALPIDRRTQGLSTAFSVERRTAARLPRFDQTVRGSFSKAAGLPLGQVARAGVLPREVSEVSNLLADWSLPSLGGLNLTFARHYARRDCRTPSAHQTDWPVAR